MRSILIALSRELVNVNDYVIVYDNALTQLIQLPNRYGIGVGVGVPISPVGDGVIDGAVVRVGVGVAVTSGVCVAVTVAVGVSALSTVAEDRGVAAGVLVSNIPADVGSVGSTAVLGSSGSGTFGAGASSLIANASARVSGVTELLLTQPSRPPSIVTRYHTPSLLDVDAVAVTMVPRGMAKS